jgi:hypothetical protein
VKKFFLSSLVIISFALYALFTRSADYSSVATLPPAAGGASLTPKSRPMATSTSSGQIATATTTPAQSAPPPRQTVQQTPPPPVNTGQYKDGTYTAGPRSMTVAFEDTLADIGVSKRQIKTDFFPGFA